MCANIHEVEHVCYEVILTAEYNGYNESILQRTFPDAQPEYLHCVAKSPDVKSTSDPLHLFFFDEY